MSARSDLCFGTSVGATTLLLRGQTRLDQCFDTSVGATTLLLLGQARLDRCFDTPVGATILLLRGQARICSVLCHTFGFQVYCVHLIHSSQSR